MVVPTFTAAMTVAMAAPVCCALGAMCAFAYTTWRHREEAAVAVGGPSPPAQAFGPSEGARQVLQILERQVGAEEGALRWAEEKMRLLEQFASSIRRRPSLQAALVADPEGAARRERQEYERAVRPQRSRLGLEFGCSGDMACARVVAAYDTALRAAAREAAQGAAVLE
jgi:hypothetical protein